MISSCYKLTYDPAGTPVVLLNYGEKIEAELEFPLEKSVEVVQLVDAPAPFIRVAKNAVANFSVARALDAASDKEARAAVLAALVLSQSATKKPLKIEVLGYTDRYWTFANATIKSHRVRRYLETPKCRWVQALDFVATGLTQTGP